MNPLERILSEFEKELTAPSAKSQMTAASGALQIMQILKHPQRNQYEVCKIFIRAYIEYSKMEKYEYDKFLASEIIYHINNFTIDQKISLLKFTSRELRDIGFNEQADEICRKISTLRLSNTSHCSHKTVIGDLLYIASSDSKSILTFLLTIIILIFTVTLPAPHTSLAHFQFHKIKISENAILDHLANIFALLADVDGVKLVPISLSASVLIFLIKFTVFAVGLSFITSEIQKRITP